MRTAWVAVMCAGVALSLSACDSSKPTAPAAPVSTTPAAPMSTAPAAPAVAPTASDAAKGSMTSKPTEAGSAMGGTAPGNVTQPAPTGAGGPTTTGGAPEPTGGDGSKEGAKSQDAAKTTK